MATQILPETAVTLSDTRLTQTRVAKVTSKGQITIPVEIRRMLGVQPGDELVFEYSAEKGTVIRKVAEFPFNRFRGMGTGIPELEAGGPDAVIAFVRELRGHDEFDHRD